MFRFFTILIAFGGILGATLWGGSYLFQHYGSSIELGKNDSPDLSSLKKDLANEDNKKQTISMERVNFKTKDGVGIAGDYYPPVILVGEKALLLLHMMPATRSSYIFFAKKAVEEGFSSLAIDLRGHGDSVYQNDTVLDFNTFLDAEHQKSILDVRASIEFLKKKGFNEENIYAVGASIGANLALELLAENNNIKKAVLLSPGLDYRGIKADAFIKNLSASQSLYFLASSEDTYSVESVKILEALAPQGIDKERIIYEYAGHGTQILASGEDAITMILAWLKK